MRVAGAPKEVAELLSPFGEAASVSIRDGASLVRKRIVLSLAYVDARRLHTRVLGEHSHMEWDNAKTFMAETQPYNAHDWLQVLALLEFTEEPRWRPEVNELVANAQQASASAQQLRSHGGVGSISMLHALHLNPCESMRVCLARAKCPLLTWETVCKTLILTTIHDVDPTTAVQAYLAQLLPPTANAASIAGVLVCQVSAFRHTPQEYEETFAHILGGTVCRAREHLLAQSVQRLDARNTALRAATQRIYASLKRPSLTDIINSRKSAEDGGGASYLAGNQDSLRGFCNAVMLPVNTTQRIKQALYYVASLPEGTPGREEGIEQVLGGGAATMVAKAAKTRQITNPDVAALKELIGSLKHSGPPCAGLQRFKEMCVPGATGRSLQWSLLLQLYAAAYSRPAVSKELWRHVIQLCTERGGVSWVQTVASPEVESRVQEFVRQNPMDIATAVSLMLSS